jgi:hypothetical protein
LAEKPLFRTMLEHDRRRFQMKMSKAALAAIFAGGVTMLATSIPVEAQVLDSLRNRQSRRNQQQPAQACALTAPEGQAPYQLSQEECTALVPLIQAVQVSDWTAARAAIPAAQAAAHGTDARYIVGQAMLHIGTDTNDTQLQSQAIDALVASGRAQGDELRILYENQLAFATQAGDTAKAQRVRALLDAMNPNDPSRFVRQAQDLVRANNFAGAIPLYQQAIQAAQTANQTVPAEWRRGLAGAAFGARDANMLRYFREWLNAAPGPDSWHDTLAVLAEGGANVTMKLETYRLMRSAGAMINERDYIQYGEAANEARAYEEVVAVLQEGLSRNLITTNAAYARQRIAQANELIGRLREVYAQDRRDALAGSDAQRAILVGDRHYGAGEYVQAAELYRAALQKGADAGSANMRIGAALALAGNRAEAETALRAVSGPRAELASLWLLWLSSRG